MAGCLPCTRQVSTAAWSGSSREHAAAARPAYRTASIADHPASMPKAGVPLLPCSAGIVSASRRHGRRSDLTVRAASEPLASHPKPSCMLGPSHRCSEQRWLQLRAHTPSTRRTTTGATSTPPAQTRLVQAFQGSDHEFMAICRVTLQVVAAHANTPNGPVTAGNLVLIRTEDHERPKHDSKACLEGRPTASALPCQTLSSRLHADITAWHMLQPQAKHQCQRMHAATPS